MSENYLDDESSFDVLLARYESGDCSASELEALEHILLENPEKRERLITHLEQGQELRDFFKKQGNDENLLIPFPGAEVSKVNRQWWLKGAAAVAAVALLAVVLAGLFQKDSSLENHSSETLAAFSSGALPRLIYSDKAKWKVTNAPILGQQMSQGPWRLESGRVTICFLDGVRATIEGPATFDVEGDKVIKLGQGRLVASNLASQELTVVANGHRVLSAGLSFGVIAGSQGESGTYVFQGTAEIMDSLQQFGSVDAGSFKSITESIENRKMSLAERMSFQQSLIFNSGIVKMEGATLLFKNDIDSGLMAEEADGTVFLIPENQAKKQQKIFVTHKNTKRVEGNLVDRRVHYTVDEGDRSYLIHASPMTRVEEKGTESFTGSIRFQSPIKAIITSERLLNASEAIFSDSNEVYGGGRGLETRHLWEVRAKGSPISDKVQISEDRMSLFFDLNVGSGFDQIRVITAN